MCHRMTEQSKLANPPFSGGEGASREAFGHLLVGIYVPVQWKRPWLWGCRVCGVESPCAGSEGVPAVGSPTGRVLESQDDVWLPVQTQVTRGSV